MPTRNLTPADNFSTICEWLGGNLEGSIIPVAANLNQVPEKEKGLYFWFMKPEGYEALSKYVQITPVEPRYERVIEGVKYHLVYLGSAGTGKKGNSDLRERLGWHIDQEHTPGSVCHGSLSTLRAGIGSLLSEDLINANTEVRVNAFLEKWYKLFWIVYPKNARKLIDNDELILIKTLKPLLNIRNNLNSWNRAETNPTKLYRERRNRVYEDTRNRLKCADETPEKQRKVKKPTEESPSFQHQILNEEGNCIEFTVTNIQSIATVVRGIEGLPAGECNYLIMDSSNRNTLLYANTINGGWRKTGTSANGQNIYTCFAKSDKGYAERHGYARQLRWQIIQDEMNSKQVEEIVVKVCTNLSESNNTVESSENVVENNESTNGLQSKKSGQGNLGDLYPHIGAALDERLSDNRHPKLLILPCTGRKQPNNLIEDNNHFGAFPPVNIGRGNSYRRINALGQNPFPHVANLNAMPPINCSQAIERYNGLLFGGRNGQRALMIDKIATANLHVLIISALYGILRWNDGIINYNLTIDLNDWVVNGDSLINQAIKHYIQFNNISNDLVFFMLSPNTDYLPAINPLNPLWTSLWTIQPGRGGNNNDNLNVFLNLL